MNIAQYCGLQNVGEPPGTSSNESACPVLGCPTEENYEYVPEAPEPCFCAAPLNVEYRLKSPGFSAFSSYMDSFDVYLTNGLVLALYQLKVESFEWEEGPRLKMDLKLYPTLFNNSGNITRLFNDSEIRRIRGMFTGWLIPDSDIFGPYELLDFTLRRPYKPGMFVLLNSDIWRFETYFAIFHVKCFTFFFSFKLLYTYSQVLSTV